MTTQLVLTKAVSEALLAEKSILGVTYDRITEETGISRSQVIRYFKGQRSMTLSEMESICKVLGLDVFDVIEKASARVGK